MSITRKRIQQLERRLGIPAELESALTVVLASSPQNFTAFMKAAISRANHAQLENCKGILAADPYDLSSLSLDQLKQLEQILGTAAEGEKVLSV